MQQHYLRGGGSAPPRSSEKKRGGKAPALHAAEWRGRGGGQQGPVECQLIQAGGMMTADE